MAVPMRLGAAATMTWVASYCCNADLALPEIAAFVASKSTYDEPAIAFGTGRRAWRATPRRQAFRHTP